MSQRDHPLPDFADLTPTKGSILLAIRRFLESRRPDTWAHVTAVAREATRLAQRFGADLAGARLAGYAHDLAAVVPPDRMVSAARALGLDLSPADLAIPQVLHGRVAAAALQSRLKLGEEDVLNAIRYHTTLRRGASRLEKIVFIADKIAYDPTTPRTDYDRGLREGLERSLDAAAFAYLDFVIQHQAELGWKLHPDLLAAHEELGKGEVRKAP